MADLARIILGLWLLTVAVLRAAWLPLPFEAFISAALAAAAAVLLALDSKPLTRQLRVLTLVLFLFAFAAARVSGLPVEGAALGILAGAAGVLMLIKK